MWCQCWGRTQGTPHGGTNSSAGWESGVNTSSLTDEPLHYINTPAQREGEGREEKALQTTQTRTPTQQTDSSGRRGIMKSPQTYSEFCIICSQITTGRLRSPTSAGLFTAAFTDPDGQSSFERQRAPLSVCTSHLLSSVRADRRIDRTPDDGEHTVTSSLLGGSCPEGRK